MEYRVISATVQELDGEKFYLCGEYFRHRGKLLHRAVWEKENGKIPNGYQIHHIDGNKHNNDINNLTIMKTSEHMRFHSKTDEGMAKSKKWQKAGISAAPEWHKSPEGREWHRNNGKHCAAIRQDVAYKCTYCGANYFSKKVYADGQNHFCGNNCRAAYGRRLKAERKAADESQIH